MTPQVIYYIITIIIIRTYLEDRILHQKHNTWTYLTME